MCRVARHVLVSPLLACIIGLGPSALAQPRNPPVTGTFIPVIINIYPNAGISEQEARDAIEEANKGFRQASVRLVPVQVNTINSDSGGPGVAGGDDGAGPGTAGDGDFAKAEVEKAQTFGEKELRKLPNQKGIKVSFGRTPFSGKNTPGVSLHRNGTVIVKKRTTSADTGGTIMHEIGHVLTLSAGHKIDDNTSADANGHTPNQPGPNGNGNAMAPSGRRTGTNLTADQIDELRRARGFGKCATQFRRDFPAVKCSLEFGAATDDRGDQRGSVPPAFFDIQHAVLESFHRSDRSGGDRRNINAQIMVSSVIDRATDADAMVALAFDRDARVSTGVRYAGVPGIDRIVYVELNGLRVSVLDPRTRKISFLPVRAKAETELQFLEEEVSPEATSILFDVPKDRVKIPSTARVVAVSGRMGEPDDTTDDRIFDSTETFVYDALRFQKDATLTTFGNGVPVSGRPYRFKVAGLAAASALTLFLNDAVVFRGQLDGTGRAEGSFVFPDLSTREFHFLTAQDETGEFAYSITCPED